MTLLPALHTPCPVPPDFDQLAYGRVATAAATYSNSGAWASYASGFNGLAFRFAAADETHERFVAAITGPAALSPSGPRFVQEESLFSFFINTLSAIECLYFALYNLGACRKPAAFPAKTTDDLRAVGVEETTKRYKNAYHDTSFAKLLMEIRQSKELSILRTYRDFLTHRGAPPRQHRLGVVPPGGVVHLDAVQSVTIPSNPKEVPSSWTSNLELTSSITTEPRAWLGVTVARMLHATDLFLQTPP